MLGAFFSALGVVATYFALRSAIAVGISITVHGRWHRITKHGFWFAVALAIIAAFAFMLAGGAYQS